MLELRGVSYAVSNKAAEELTIIQNASLTIPKSHFMAVVGPSGCGKTTLLKVVAGILEESAGSLLWEDRDLADDAELDLTEVGYVPQFSVAYDHLSVEESVEHAAALRVATIDRAELEQITDSCLKHAGLEDIADRRVAVLSGGQKRRLGLAMELVSNPALLLCDEVTSGLDPRSETEIVQLLHALSRTDERIVINVTHSLSHLELYDSVLFLYDGHVAYHGKPESINHYFSVESTEAVYPRLTTREPKHWHESWQKHRSAYYRSAALNDQDTESEPPSSSEFDDLMRTQPLPSAKETPAATELSAPDLEESLEEASRTTPGPWRQFAVLLQRRFTIFLRDRGQLGLQMALLIGFPLLVVLFTPGLFDSSQGMGIPPMPNQLTASELIGSPNLAEGMANAQDIGEKQFRLGVLLSGLVMFQVILLSLIGSNNGSREIVSERMIFEKEKLAGLSPFSYLLSKVAFLAILVLAQSGWMAAFVHHFTSMPGQLWDHFILLFLVNASLTSVCLAISSLSRTTEQASLLGVYLVGFQLPLSNAVLALPAVVATITQPFIAAYWGWSGQLARLVESTSYDVGIEKAVPTSLASFELCVAVLGAHVAVALFVAYIGVHRHRWD